MKRYVVVYGPGPTDVSLREDVNGGLVDYEEAIAAIKDAVEKARAEERNRCTKILWGLFTKQQNYFASFGSAGCPEYDVEDCIAAINAIEALKDEDKEDAGMAKICEEVDARFVRALEDKDE